MGQAVVPVREETENTPGTKNTIGEIEGTEIVGVDGEVVVMVVVLQVAEEVAEGREGIMTEIENGKGIVRKTEETVRRALVVAVAPLLIRAGREGRRDTEKEMVEVPGGGDDVNYLIWNLGRVQTSFFLSLFFFVFSSGFDKHLYCD